MLSILVGAVVAFAFGALWFTVLFGRTWAKLMGFTADKMTAEEQAEAKKMGMTVPLILNFITNVIFVSVVSYLFPQLLAISFYEFLKVLLIIWLGFSFPIYANSAIWERKSWKLVVINSAQGIIATILVSSVIYYMQ